MLWVRKLMGWVLVGMAAYFIRPLLPESWGIFLLAGVAFFAGLHLGWLDKTKAAFRSFNWLKTGAGLAGIIIATLLIGSWVFRGPGVTWQPYSDHILWKRPALVKNRSSSIFMPLGAPPAGSWKMLPFTIRLW